VLTLLVIAGRLALNPWWGRQHNRHLVFLPTVMAVAGLAGLGPGLLATVMATVALAVFWMDTGVAALANADLLLFFFTSVAICLLLQSLRIARDRAASASRSRQQVMAVVAHDLRNPLTTIMMTASTLQKTGAGGGLADPALAGRYLKAIQRSASRMNDLIRDLVDASLIERDELTLTLQPEALGSIVDEALELHAPQAGEQGVALEAAVTGGAVEILCDRRRLLQVLTNLIGNALRATPAGGRVTVRAGPEASGRARFAVEDSGEGIPADHLPFLFERYWSRAPGGVGLGLYIARSIVTAHGGEIGVRSQPGAGATFWFTVGGVPRPR